MKEHTESFKNMQERFLHFCENCENVERLETETRAYNNAFGTDISMYEVFVEFYTDGGIPA